MFMSAKQAKDVLNDRKRHKEEAILTARTASKMHRESVSRTAAKNTERKLMTLRLDNLEIESALSKYSEKQDTVRKRAQSAREMQVSASLDKSLRWQRSIDDFRVKCQQHCFQSVLR